MYSGFGTKNILAKVDRLNLCEKSQISDVWSVTEKNIFFVKIRFLNFFRTQIETSMKPLKRSPGCPPPPGRLNLDQTYKLQEVAPVVPLRNYVLTALYIFLTRFRG